MDRDRFAATYVAATTAAKQHFRNDDLDGILFYVDGADLWAFRRSYGTGMWDGYKFLGKRSGWVLQGWDDI